MKIKTMFIGMFVMTCLSIAGCRKGNDVSTLAGQSAQKLNLAPGVHSLEISLLSSSVQYDCLVNSYTSYAGVNLVGNPDLAASAWTYSGTPGIGRDFFGFSGISFLPPGTTVTSATLNLYEMASGTAVANPSGNSYYPGSPYNSYGTNACYIKRVTGTWSESTITWNNQPSTTTVNQATVPASTSQWNYNVTVDVTALVQDIVNSGQNNGFCLQLQSESYYRNLNFAGHRNSDATKWPKLSITYSIP
ncbi:DNRLRE domain-containing protein [Chitinophaga sp.]|uniref:DNRLRE domain-containing protein n=1 Tax=Chitinophaga sp. TaxID=1869181 RepID=UPI0031DADCD3